MSTFEDAVDRLLAGTSVDSQKLRNLASKITKVPKSFNIPSDYIVEKKERETLDSSKKDLPEES